MVNLQAPIINLSSTFTSVTANAVSQDGSGVTLAHTLASVLPFDCQASTTVYRAGATLSGLSAARDNQKYVCFKATSGIGNVAHKAHQINLVSPPDDSSDDQAQIDQLKRLIQNLIAQIIALLQRRA